MRSLGIGLLAVSAFLCVSACVEPPTPGLLEAPQQANPIFIEKRKCELLVPSSPIDFERLPVDCGARKRKISLVVLGGKNCIPQYQVHAVRLETPSRGAFRIVAQDKEYFPTPKGLQYDITVSYQAQSLGTDTGVLRVHMAEQTLAIPIIGRGIKPEIVENFLVNRNPARPADVLIVLRNSESMKRYQQNIAQNLLKTLSSLEYLRMDYQIGIISSDVSGQNSPAGCLLGPNPVISAHSEDAARQITENINRIPFTGNHREKGLDAVRFALERQAQKDIHCNRLPFRDAAHLELVLISDKEDESIEPIDFYINLLGRIKKRSSNYSVMYIPTSLRKSYQSARYFQFTEKSRHGYTSSISEKDWGSFVKGCITPGFIYQLFLTYPPDLATLQVWINGKKWERDPILSYDIKANAIDICTTLFCYKYTCHKYPDNTEVKVTYRSSCQAGE